MTTSGNLAGSPLRHGVAGSTVFLTGATGEIGGEILCRLLASDTEKIYCLMRNSEDAGLARIRKRLCGRIDNQVLETKLVILPGDIAEVGLGMEKHAERLLRKQVNLVFHCAANTSFLQNRECWRINYKGTQNLFELCQQSERKPTVYYFGSSSTCGTLADRVLKEDDFPFHGNDYFAPYASSKAAVELDLLPEMSNLDIVILRPSMVAPDAPLPDQMKREIAWPLALMSQCRALPLRREAKVDIVPLSYVADYTMRIATADRRHRCYHITAGTEGAKYITEILGTVSDSFSEPEIQCVGNTGWSRFTKGMSRREKLFIRQVSIYFPFINQNIIFDNARLFDEFGSAQSERFDLSSFLPELTQSINLSEALAQSRYD